MQIHVSGKNFEVGEAFRQHVESRLHDITEKYFNEAVSARVVMEKQRNLFHAEIVMHLPTGLVMQANGSGAEAYAAFDQALERMEKRLRRYKSKLKSHVKNRRRKPIVAQAAPSFVIAPEPEPTEAALAQVAGAPAEGEAREAEEFVPAVVAETEEPILEMSVGDAVLQLELGEATFVIFRNVAHGGINVVFRREDGHIGWVDPGPCQRAGA